MKYVIPAAVAIGTGVVILLSYFWATPMLVGVRITLVDWAVVLGGLAVLVGVLNLLLVNARRIQSGQRGWPYSLITLLAVLLTLAVAMLEGFGKAVTLLGDPTSVTNVLFQGVVVAGQAALAALVMIFLVVAAVRLLRIRPGGWSLVFVVVLLVTLAGWLPLGPAGVLNRFREWLLNVPAAAGARGILLGVALGVLVVGLRVLTGIERPYKD